tara:strand:+ start:8929 stop:9807 length:879 start_codon:yes stop_codon:yes gene_type:complete
MIISASYRTDIPAFYADWFAARLDAGFCEVTNPYNGKPYRVSLTAEDARAFVFWTRNAGPLMPQLTGLAGANRPFSVSFTIIGYPRQIDQRVIPVEQAIEQVRQLSRLHPRCVVWRYDPILLTDITTTAWHETNFRGISDRLNGVCDEVTVSFATFYRKTERNLKQQLANEQIGWRDPPADEKRQMLLRLAEIAAGNGQHLTVCSQPELTSPETGPARCIDSERLSAIAGQDLAGRTKGNRPGCLCAESRDIGAYDSCPHGCAYCYAVRSRPAALENWRQHDPASPILIPAR